MHIPPFCQLLSAATPLLPASHLAEACFDPAQLHPDDFSRCAVPPVRGVAKRQAEHLAGRLCAQAALRQLCGHAVVPGRDADGVPLWPPGTTGSITHGSGRAAALVARSSDWQGLGIDLERPLSSARAARLAAEILTPDELLRAADLTPLALAEQVTLTFSLKESLFKALFPLVRQRFYFHDAELLEITGQQARLRLLIDLHTDWPAGSELHGHFTERDGHLLSVVAIAAR